MSTTRQDYIERAIKILNNAQQTSYSKGVAREILCNAGFSEREINEFKSSEINSHPFVMVT